MTHEETVPWAGEGFLSGLSHAMVPGLQAPSPPGSKVGVLSTHPLPLMCLFDLSIKVYPPISDPELR